MKKILLVLLLGLLLLSMGFDCFPEPMTPEERAEWNKLPYGEKYPHREYIGKVIDIDIEPAGNFMDGERVIKIGTLDNGEVLIVDRKRPLDSVGYHGKIMIGSKVYRDGTWYFFRNE